MLLAIFYKLKMYKQKWKVNFILKDHRSKKTILDN